MKLDTNYVFPYKYWDAFYENVKWDGDKLYMTICKCYENETLPNELEVVFHGVTWMRTTYINNYPPVYEDDWTDGYDPNKPLEEYLLVDKEQFNNDFTGFISDDQEGIRCLADNVVFFNETLFFDCTDIEIVRAECIDYMAKNLAVSANVSWIKDVNKFRRANTVTPPTELEISPCCDKLAKLLYNHDTK